MIKLELKFISKIIFIISLFFTLASCGSENLYNSKKADMIFTDVNGKKIDLLDYKGKYLIINYWASWCSPCVKEIPELIDFNNKYKDRANIIGVNIEGLDLPELSRVIKKFRMNFPNFTSDIVKNILDIDVIGFPTTYIFDREGVLIKTIQGPVDINVLKGYVE